MKLGILISSVVLFIVLGIVRIVMSYSFDFNCNQYLKRAADCNNVVMAKENIDTAIAYLEKHDLTNGVVSIFFHQPVNDIGFWYNNLKASSEELFKVTEEATQLERSNLLIKLRETLLDNEKERGSVVTCPSGISIYPFNVPFFLAFVFLFGVISSSFHSLWDEF